VPTRLAHLAALLLLLAPPAVQAQIQAPRPVEEGEDATEEPRPPPRQAGPRAAPPRTEPAPPAGAPVEPAGPAARGGRAGEPRAGEPGPEAAPLPDPSAPNAPDTIPAPRTPPPPPPEKLAARAIEPVGASSQTLLRAWTERRTALREQDPPRAASAAAALLDARRRLALGNLSAMAAAEVRDSARALESNLPVQAVAHAELAVALAPDLADGHLALARARLAQAPRQPLQILGSIGDGVAAAFREPHTRRALLADVMVALLAAVLAATAALVLLLLLRNLPLFLHDVRHLPLLRGSAPIQASFLGLVVLAAPLVFGLGPLPALAVALTAAWLYLTHAERAAATVALLLVTAIPWAAEWTARQASWAGTVAETVHELEHGLLDDRVVDELAARAGEAPPPPLAAALGRHYKRRGDLAAALRWYDVASRGDEKAVELLVNVGNVRFMQDDLEGAKAAYLLASDRAGGDLTVQAAAHYDLSKLYLRVSDIGKSSAARDRAEQEDGPFLRRYGADDDFSANRYLVDVPVPAAKLEPLAADPALVEGVREAARTRLAGVVPRAAWPWAPLALLGALWALALAAAQVAPSKRCEKCGRPACPRCDPAGGALCGQCLNVYVKKGAVEPRFRQQKEVQVRRRRRLGALGTKALAVLTGGGGYALQGAAGRALAVFATVLFAAFLILFRHGVLPPTHPSPWATWAKLVAVVPVAALVYLLAVRDQLRRTRG